MNIHPFDELRTRLQRRATRQAAADMASEFTSQLEPAPPTWWSYLLPMLVALNAFALGVQFVTIRQTRAVLDDARTVQAESDANLALSRQLLANAAATATAAVAAAPLCQSYVPREQDDAGQVSSL